MLVHQILKSKADGEVITIRPSVTAADAAEAMSKRKIGAVVVSEDGKTALGILSERDIVRELGMRGTICLSDKVEKMMTRELVTTTREESADQVLEKMTEGRFRHMPVLDGAEMVGLISIGDVVKARLFELSKEKEALEGMIMGH